jgi:hypothetical protein
MKELHKKKPRKSRAKLIKDRAGPKPRLMTEVTPEILEKVEELSKLGMTQFYIAGYFEMNESTWYERCKTFPELSKTYWRGKSKGVALAMECLNKLMLLDNERAIMFYIRNLAKFSDVGSPEDEYKNDKENLKVPSLKMVDPIEASRIYQSIMMGD